MAEVAVLEACKRFTDSVVDNGAERLQATDFCKSLLLASSSGQRQHRQRVATQMQEMLAPARSLMCAAAIGSLWFTISASFQHDPMRRFNMLVILEDVIYMWTDVLKATGDLFKRFLPMILQLAAAGDPATIGDFRPFLMAHLEEWRQSRFADLNEIEKYYDLILEAEVMSYHQTWHQIVATLCKNEAEIYQSLDREIMEARSNPPMHHHTKGLPNAPWHELPAANALLLKRTRGYPMKSYALPPGGFPLKIDNGADRCRLKSEARKLHQTMLCAFEKQTKADDVQDIDPLGNIIWKDSERPTRNYWGWSLDRIDKRKRLARELQRKAIGYADIPKPRPNPPSHPAMGRGRYGRNDWYNDPRDQRFDDQYDTRGPGRGRGRGDNFNRGGRGGRGGGFGRGGTPYHGRGGPPNFSQNDRGNAMSHPRGGFGEWRGGGEYIGSGVRDGRSN
ncbi:hypothetical protein D0864_02009 [Hortaea werneckii]|uniref:CID domain-containing protein n=1 Tax=Hortaea werneckii TaxID=91943 RepID=A0A3M7H211_HORWE|nr:hypothetical protein D0864_02009 [Hortaea werneckii]